jgi:hypothetical protein
MQAATQSRTPVASVTRPDPVIADTVNCFDEKKLADCADTEEPPSWFCASAVHVYVRFAVSPVTVIGDVAPSNCRDTPPSLEAHQTE